jgi:phytoene synthase
VTEAPVPVATGVDEAVRVLAAGSRSFHFASLFLPADRRGDAALLYAFCRHVDDVADEASDAATARAALQALVAELVGERSPGPLITAVRALFARRGIDVVHALDLIDAVASDLGQVRVADDGELVRYGYGVAGTVGLMMCGVLGVDDPDALPHAVDLGVAMQITNICRDVAEDARLGRVYLPASRLGEHGVLGTPSAVLGASGPVAVVVGDLLALADRYYRSAEDGLRYIPWRARVAILVAARVYRAIGVQLREHGCDALAGRTVVGLGRKVRTALAALFAFVGVSRRRAPHDATLHRPLVGLSGADPRA